MKMFVFELVQFRLHSTNGNKWGQHLQERKTALAKKVAEKAKTYTTLAESSELFKKNLKNRKQL
jgi:hypothetical protein